MKDFIGQELSINDKVVINSRGFNNSFGSFQIRVISGFTDKFILLEASDNPCDVNKTTPNLLVKLVKQQIQNI